MLHLSFASQMTPLSSEGGFRNGQVAPYDIVMVVICVTRWGSLHCKVSRADLSMFGMTAYP